MVVAESQTSSSSIFNLVPPQGEEARVKEVKDDGYRRFTNYSGFPGVVPGEGAASPFRGEWFRFSHECSPLRQPFSESPITWRR